MKRQEPWDLDLAAPADEGGDGLADLQEYLRGLRQRWRLVLLVVMLAVGASVVHYAITPPQYSATTRLQIERRTSASVLGDQAPWLENLWNMEYYPTQYKLLGSRGMAERVVRDLRLDEDPRFNRNAGAVGRSASGAEADRAALAAIANRIRGGLSVEPVQGTQLVDLTYRSSDPELAAELANGFAETFIEWGLETRSGRVSKASTFLNEQIETLKDEVTERERQLQVLSRDDQALNFNPDANVTSQRLQNLNEQYMEAKRRRIEKEARYQELEGTPDRTVVDLEASSVVSNLMREQIQLEREYETKLRTYKPDWPPMVELKAQIDEGSQHLESLIAEEASRVRQAARSEYQSALRQEKTLEEEIEELKERMLENSSVAVQYNNLQVEVATRRELLDELLKRQSETEVALRIQGNRESNVRVVDEALVPPAPYHPSLKRSVSMGLAAGLLLGLGGAFLLEFMDRSIKSADEVERLLGLPVLAVVPDLDDDPKGSAGYGYGYGGKSKRGVSRSQGDGRRPRKWLEKRTADGPPDIELVPHHRPRLAVSEAYRALRTALLLSSAEGLRMVAVTSAGAGEGKTVTASNLAVVMAQLGRKVLLIDGDLRKPRLHSVFNVSNRTGLVHLLTGGAEMDGVLQRTAVSNLWVIPSGPIPPNPSELLASSHMTDLLQEAESRFDLILFDTPPALAVTDATLVGALADGVILCLRSGRVLREDARACRDRLQRADVKVLGAVLNAFRRQPGRYSKDHYYYEAYAATLEGSHGDAA